MTDPTGALPGLDSAPASAGIPRVAGYDIEDELRAARPVTIAGVDEVGRGAWAGPVVVCAAVTDLSPPPVLQGRGKKTIALTDSKLLTEAHRESFADLLPEWLTGHAIGASSPEEIDEVGMTEALRRAAVRALESLSVQPDVVILDGKHDFLGKPWRVRCEVKADQRSVTVAAASVLAKVHRDRLLAGLDGEFPVTGSRTVPGTRRPSTRRRWRSTGQRRTTGCPGRTWTTSPLAAPEEAP